MACRAGGGAVVEGFAAIEVAGERRWLLRDERIEIGHQLLDFLLVEVRRRHLGAGNSVVDDAADRPWSAAPQQRGIGEVGGAASAAVESVAIGAAAFEESLARRLAVAR